jgi:hypothetical protein
LVTERAAHVLLLEATAWQTRRPEESHPEQGQTHPRPHPDSYVPLPTQAMNPETHRLVTACWAEGVLSKAVALPKETTIGEAVLQTASRLRDQVHDSFEYKGVHIPVNDMVISIVPKGLLSFVCFGRSLTDHTVPWDDRLTSLTSSGEEVLSVIIRPPDGHTPVMTHVLQSRSLNSDLVRRGAGELLRLFVAKNYPDVYSQVKQAYTSLMRCHLRFQKS